MRSSTSPRRAAERGYRHLGSAFVTGSTAGPFPRPRRRRDRRLGERRRHRVLSTYGGQTVSPSRCLPGRMSATPERVNPDHSDPKQNGPTQRIASPDRSRSSRQLARRRSCRRRRPAAARTRSASSVTESPDRRGHPSASSTTSGAAAWPRLGTWSRPTPAAARTPDDGALDQRDGRARGTSPTPRPSRASTPHSAHRRGRLHQGVARPGAGWSARTWAGARAAPQHPQRDRPAWMNSPPHRPTSSAGASGSSELPRSGERRSTHPTPRRRRLERVRIPLDEAAPDAVRSLFFRVSRETPEIRLASASEIVSWSLSVTAPPGRLGSFYARRGPWTPSPAG